MPACHFQGIILCIINHVPAKAPVINHHLDGIILAGKNLEARQNGVMHKDGQGICFIFKVFIDHLYKLVSSRVFIGESDRLARLKPYKKACSFEIILLNCLGGKSVGFGEVYCELRAALVKIGSKPAVPAAYLGDCPADTGGGQVSGQQKSYDSFLFQDGIQKMVFFRS